MGVLQEINNQFIGLMRKEAGVIGAWEFGSALHGTKDEYSDIDIVFLVDKDNYAKVDDKLKNMLESVCEKVLIFWGEGFNGETIKNYDCILEKDGLLFQYDIFLLNNRHVDDFMCQIHYMDLQKQDIIFDTNHVVERLIEKAPKGQQWNEDVIRLIQTYWLHVNMSAKYFLRNDFFKLEGVLRILMDTHTSLLLTLYDKITWGGTANKLHYLEEEQQKHLKKYYCCENYELVRENLVQSMLWFEEDVASSGNKEVEKMCREIGEPVKKAWSRRFI